MSARPRARAFAANTRCGAIYRPRPPHCTPRRIFLMPQPLRFWGGIESSVVRLNDEWRDQVVETGHHERGPRDIELLAGLGITGMRYPLLWERHVPGARAWHDQQMGALQRHRLDVIA